MFFPTPCISSAFMRLFNLWDVVNLSILLYFCLRRSIFQANKPSINLVSKQTNSEFLSRVQTDAILLANNSQHCWMLHVASACTPCCMLLDVVACCYAKFETGQTFQPTTPNISFVPWSSKRSATMLECVRTALSTLVGPRTLITHGLQRLRGCISQHCWCYNVGSCCVRLHAAGFTEYILL